VHYVSWGPREYIVFLGGRRECIVLLGGARRLGEVLRPRTTHVLGTGTVLSQIHARPHALSVVPASVSPGYF
jgi:hypothetical protein